MDRAAMALAKLKVKNIRFDTGLGCKPKFTAEDVAAALAGTETGPYYLALAKYTGDLPARLALETTVMCYLGDHIKNKKLLSDGEYAALHHYTHCLVRNVEPYRITDIDRQKCKVWHQLVRLLVDHAVIDHRCPKCNGTGNGKRYPVGRDFAYKPCTRCGGSTRVRPSNRSNARFLGVTHPTWAEKYEPVYRDLYPMLAIWEQHAFKHLSQQLFSRIDHQIGEALRAC
ncbi:hypothetical protein [Endozoicomonas sp. Mp262]|uniref:hypothetical protein n=1 Tax=Endozoicomonas sp. Mp262 TaxID=2919499 RepID=UPI0021D81A10